MIGLDERDRQAAWDAARATFTAIQRWDDFIYDRGNDPAERLRDAEALTDSWARLRYDVDIAGAWLNGDLSADDALERALRLLSDALEQMARMVATVAPPGQRSTDTE